MTVTTTIISALLGASAFFAYASAITNSRLRGKIETLRTRLAEQDADRHRADARYETVRRQDGSCHVYRVTSNRAGEPTYTLIKTFDTDDAEYNLNEAKELVENIEKKLCYD